MGEGQWELLARWVVAAGRQRAVGEERRVERAHLMAAEEVLRQRVFAMLWDEAGVLQHLVVAVELEGGDSSWI